jgi:plasmid stabilization system protein ParE
MTVAWLEQIKGQEVRILAVLHTSRKWPDEFTNLE